MTTDFNQKIDMATSIAMNIWERAPQNMNAFPYPSVAIAVYTPYGSLTKTPEWFVTISDGPPGTGLFYFGRRRQIYVVANFKCVKRQTPKGTFYYEIIPSSDDIQIGKSPLRPIGCSVHEKDPIINIQRLYALDFVYDEVKKSFG